ncbi:MAG: CHASE domain-containing protein [Burkholderiales bacterium]
MQSYEQILRGGVGLFAASIDVNRSQWRRYVNSLQVKEAYPGVKGIGFAPVIAHDEKAEHLAKLWQEGFTDYKILPQGDRSTYTPVLFREPLDGLNRRILGFDMMSEPIRRKAMERARDTGAAALTGKVQAVVENEAQNSASVVMVLPVYDHNTSPFSLDSRRAALKGYVFASFRVSELIEATLGERLAEIGIDLEVFESVAIANETML